MEHTPSTDLFITYRCNRLFLEGQEQRIGTLTGTTLLNDVSANVFRTIEDLQRVRVHIVSKIFSHPQLKHLNLNIPKHGCGILRSSMTYQNSKDHGALHRVDIHQPHLNQAPVFHNCFTHRHAHLWVTMDLAREDLSNGCPPVWGPRHTPTGTPILKSGLELLTIQPTRRYSIRPMPSAHTHITK
jgi:hypothetical protein